MIRPLPEGRTGRVAAIAISLLGLALLWLLIVTPLLDWQAALRDSRQQHAALLDRMQALVARLPTLEAELAAKRADDPVASLVLSGPSDAVAAAELQQAVQSIVQHEGGRLESVEMFTAQPVGAYRRIPLRVALTAPYAAQIAILHAITTARPGMLVDDLTLQAPPLRQIGQPMPASFTVLAYRAEAGP